MDLAWSIGIAAAVILLAIIISLIAAKIYIKLTTGMCHGTEKLHGKTVIVTGANTGIGFETAKELARRGARVILACRDLDKAVAAKEAITKETQNFNVICKKLDLASFKSVRAFAQDVLTNERQIDILVNNAGTGGLKNIITEDGLLVTLQVNHFAPFLLTNLLLQRICESAPARIIIVSSTVHRFARINLEEIDNRSINNFLVYQNSKLCNIAFSNELAKRLSGTSVTVNSLHPGVVYTEAYRNVPLIFRLLILLIIKIFLKSPYEGAQTSIYLATSAEVEKVSGSYFEDCKIVKPSPKSEDEFFCKQLWDISEKLTQMKRPPEHE